MKINVKQISLALVLALLLISSSFSTCVTAASLNSFCMTGGNEFEVATLTYSLGRAPTNAYYAIAQQFNNCVSGGQSVQYYKFNYTPPEESATVDYVTTGTFTYYVNPIRSSSVDDAVKKCVIAQTTLPVSSIVKFYTSEGITTAVGEGPQVISTDSSLTIGRYADSTKWKAWEKTVNAANPVGQIKFCFSKDLNKSSVDNIHVYLNNGTQPPADEAIIKGLLFGEFVDRDLEGTLSNELSGDIAFNYTDLKEILKTFNNDQEVTSVKIEGLAIDNSWVSMTINIF